MTDQEDARDTIDILSLGEAVVDLISTTLESTLEGAESFQRFPGGAVANVAMNLARLGYRSALAVCVGEDGFGRFLENEFQDAGVMMDYLQTTAHAPTTIVPITRHTKSPDFIIYRGADKHLRGTAHLKNAVKRSKVIHTSAFSLSHDPTRNTIMECLQIAHQAGKMISLDPNYHPQIWPDRPNFMAYLKDIYPLVQVTKPSLDDCARIFGTGLTPAEYVERFLGWGADLVVITMGKEGVYLGTSQGERYRLESQALSAADVTGAGDAFWAGLLSGLVMDLAPLEAAQLGQVVAEYKINRVGPVESFPSLNLLREKAKNVKHSALN